MMIVKEVKSFAADRAILIGPYLAGDRETQASQAAGVFGEHVIARNLDNIEVPLSVVEVTCNPGPIWAQVLLEVASTNVHEIPLNSLIRGKGGMPTTRHDLAFLVVDQKTFLQFIERMSTEWRDIPELGMQITPPSPANDEFAAALGISPALRPFFVTAYVRGFHAYRDGFHPTCAGLWEVIARQVVEGIEYE